MNKSSVLITGARSAVTLDMARHFSRQGIAVFVGDSLSETLSFKSNSIAGSFIWPSPRHDFEYFKNTIIKIVKENKIDFMIPTCEEVFYLSQIDELKDLSFCWWDEKHKIQKFHDKWNFNQMCSELGLKVPLTRKFSNLQELESQSYPADFIFKPVFSRFASEVLFSSDANCLQKMKSQLSHESRAWLLQDRIFGTEFCSYSVCYQGKLLAHTVYGHEFTAGRGAGISFECIEKERINKWVEVFVRETNFTGQIAFDFIEDKNQDVWCLEANPRSTSGAHLLLENPQFSKCFFEPHSITSPVLSPKNQNKILSREALLMYGPGQLKDFKKIVPLLKAFLKKDVIWDKSDMNPAIHQFSVISAFVKIARAKGISILQATTEDIEWNG